MEISVPTMILYSNRNLAAVSLLFLTLVSCGGGSGGNGQSANETISNSSPPANTTTSNSSPKITYEGETNILEGSKTIGSISAYDADNDPLTFSISGDDGGLFTLSSSGALEFSQAPDYESPDDKNSDNQYELQVSVSDGQYDHSVAIGVFVDDAVEGRVLDGPVTGATLILIDSSGSQISTKQSSSDTHGAYAIERPQIPQKHFVKSITGEDVATGVSFQDLILTSLVPTNPQLNVNVSALTTVVGSDSTATVLLERFDLDATAEKVVSLDFLAAQDNGTSGYRRVNSQALTYLVSVQRLLVSTEPTPETFSQIVSQAINESGIGDFSHSRFLSALFNLTPLDFVMDYRQKSALVGAMADINIIFGNERNDPDSELYIEASRISQNIIPTLVSDLLNGTISTEVFEESLSPRSLLIGIPVPTGLDDHDLDGLASVVDPDDDGDGVRDSEDLFPLDPTEYSDFDNDGIGDNSDPDLDGDGVVNQDDAFPIDSSEWIDTDLDGAGNNADPDDDGDGVADTLDDFPLDYSESLDSDGDGIGNNADNDDDNDGISDPDDAFPTDPLEWADTDGDGEGNNSDSDDDGDGTPDEYDPDPLDPGRKNDSDGDGVADVDDAFPMDPSEYEDSDEDGIGNNSDPDDDNDGIPDLEDNFPLDPSNLDTDGDGVSNSFDGDDDDDGYGDSEDAFPLDPSEFSDNDADGVGDNSDTDDDNDGVLDLDDAFPLDPSESTDTDSDGLGNNADNDDDNDGVLDGDDAFPLDPFETTDTDQDGIGNNADDDDDNDGVTDDSDDLPLDPAESLDTDGDGLGNNADPDDDNDGVPDVEDELPLDPTETNDFDGDGVGNNADPDDDGDGVLDIEDQFPLDPTESIDTDNDGVGNNADLDDDGDGAADAVDAFPLDSTESLDTDQDGVGDNADTDDDGDGVPDSLDAFPQNPAETTDSDADGIGNNADADDDDDGVLDIEDQFPLDPTESIDTDNDGVGNNADADDDNDGVSDESDAFPTDPNETSDNDSDGVGDNSDEDDDNDGLSDFDEITRGTNPLYSDSDHDTLSDGWEVDQGRDPTRADYKVVLGVGYNACFMFDGKVGCQGPDYDSDGLFFVPDLVGPTNLFAFGSIFCALDESGSHCWGPNNVFDPFKNVDIDQPTEAQYQEGSFCAINETDLDCNEYYLSAIDGVERPIDLDVTRIVSAQGEVNYACVVDQGGISCWGDEDFDSFTSGTGVITEVELASTMVSDICVISDGSPICNGEYIGYGALPSMTGAWSLTTASERYACAVDETGAHCWGCVGGCENLLNDQIESPSTVQFPTNIQQVALGSTWANEAKCVLKHTGFYCAPGRSISGRWSVEQIFIDPDGDGYTNDVDSFPYDSTKW